MAVSKPAFGAEVLQGSLSVGLVAAYLFNKGSGDVVFDVVSGSTYDVTSITPPTLNTWTSGLAAPDITGYDFIGTTGEGLSVAAVPIASSGVGYSVVTKITPDFNNGRAAFSIAEGASPGHLDAISLDTVAEAWTRAGGGFVVAKAAGTTTLVAGTTYTIGATFASLSAREIFVNGISEGTDGTTQAAVTFDTLCIGQFIDSTPSGPYNGDMFFLYIYNRVLSAPEMLAIHNDPYQMMVVSGTTGAGSPSVGIRRRRRKSMHKAR